MPLRSRPYALLVVLALCQLAAPVLAERVVFRDGKSTMASKPPCISGDKILIEIEGLPTAIAYDRNLIDEARTFHANAQTPVLVLFAPCSATGAVARGLAGPGSALPPQPSTPTSTPARAYSAPTSSRGTSYNASPAQCGATTKKGTRCSRRAQPGRAYCYQH